MFHLNFFEWVCTQEDDEGEFWKKDVHQSFPSLENVHTGKVEANQSPQDECFFMKSVEAHCLL